MQFKKLNIFIDYKKRFQCTNKPPSTSNLLEKNDEFSGLDVDIGFHSDEVFNDDVADWFSGGDDITMRLVEMRNLMKSLWLLGKLDNKFLMLVIKVSTIRLNMLVMS